MFLHVTDGNDGLGILLDTTGMQVWEQTGGDATITWVGDDDHQVRPKESFEQIMNALGLVRVAHRLLPLAFFAFTMLAMPAGAQTTDHLQGTLDRTAEQVLSAREKAEIEADARAEAREAKARAEADDDPAPRRRKSRRAGRDATKAPPEPKPSCLKVKPFARCIPIEPKILEAYGLRSGRTVTALEMFDIDVENRAYLARNPKQ